MPWQDLSQVTDAKLCNAIPAFAGGLTPFVLLAYYFRKQPHFAPNMTKITAASITEAAVFICSTYWNLLFYKFNLDFTCR